MVIRKIGLILVAAAIAVLLSVSGASAASYGLHEISVQFEEEGSAAATQAGGPPFQLSTSFALDREVDPRFGEIPIGSAKDLLIHVPLGMVGNPTGVPESTGKKFTGITQV